MRPERSWTECATLVDRLTRNFYAFDSALHSKERAQADWKARFEYDDFERLSKRVDNDVIETSIQRSLGGNAFSLTRTGEGSTFVTYDLAGKPVWRRDAAGTDSVFTWRPQPHQSTLTTIRRGSGAARLTTAVVQALNPAGQPTSLIEVGGAAQGHFDDLGGLWIETSGLEVEEEPGEGQGRG